MINKLAKAQKSWIAKLILTLTALSFMSLFGITGYLTSASNNRTVIKVDNIEISQAEFNYELQKELNAAKNILDVPLDDDANQDFRESLTNAVASKMFKDALIDRTAQKYHVSFSNDYVNAIIAKEPSFRDLAGNFNKELFRRILRENNITEAEYVRALKRNLAEQILTLWPAQNVYVPQVLVDAQTKVDNKRRTFKYMTIEPDSLKVDREISEDEIAQYYEDFASMFVEPERRDLSLFYLSLDDIATYTDVTEEDIKAYYDEHIDEYEKKERRQVLQMMFEDEQSALKAFEALENGEDFYEVASQQASQTREETNLGVVFENDLVFEIAEDTFALDKGGYTKPIAVGDIFQIIKVEDIIAPEKTDYQEAQKQIKQELVNDRLYETVYDLVSKTDDALAEGKTLSQIADQYKKSVYTVKGLSDDGSALEVAQNLKDVIKEQDVVEEAFSYAQGEVSSTIETNNGLLVLRVDRIVESHQKPAADVTEDIKSLWAENEKEALAQEMLNDIMHDLQEGDDFAKTAQRYGLHVYRSQPITRNETFASLNYQQIRELFMLGLDTPYQTNIDGNYVIAVGVEDFDNADSSDTESADLVRLKVRYALVKDLQKAMLDSYAKNYKTKIKYNLMGLAD